MKPVVLYELLFIEMWDDRWHPIGLFESQQAAEEFKLSEIKKLKRTFKGDDVSFNDYFRFMISKRKFYKSTTPKKISKTLDLLRSKKDLKENEVEKYIKNVKELVDYFDSSKLEDYAN